MGNFYSLFSSWIHTEPARILLLGLDAAGKTSILYKVKLNENIQTIPTIGFNVETVSPCKGISFTVWDVGGQYKIRQLWKYYYQNSNGLMFVVDSADPSRFDEARQELHGILNDDSMRGVPVVIMANKADLPTATSASEIVQGLGLDKLRNKWFIQRTCATSGDGLYEAMAEMGRLVKEHKRNNPGGF